MSAIVKMLQVGQLGTNCYFLIDSDTNKAAVIDPGGEADRLAALVKQGGWELEYILLTHGHYDHTTGVPELQEYFPNAKIYIHQADANGAGNALFPLASEVDELLLYDEGDTLPLGELTIEVMHTPGHSRGSVVLKAEDYLFAGDTLFCGSMGRTDLPGGSHQQIMDSLYRLYKLEGDYKVCPGHDRVTTLERERQGNFFVAQAVDMHENLS